ncbi:Nucleotide-binding universal stress protein, UspA family [Pedobacter sp. ok626]|uniref:universal stress protein n=1 Tax=Pedobacter sp. ok626 TaxID=1761882 RepID=UPI0008902EF0|nr:universal stress protein [Pedobacter sp. ok626]SDK91519.1 Nucleotide-binding universal stress protein, UspA family [Pedobacter sp. ok626]
MEKINILIPTDFSELSFEAFKMVDLLRSKFVVKLHLLHVIEANDLVFSDHPELSEGVDLSFYQKELARTKANFDLLKQKGIDFEEQISVGLLTTEIKRSSILLAIDLVIIGINEHHTLLDKLSSSEAQQLVRHLAVPVISLKLNTPLSQTLNDILLVADYEQPGKGIQLNLIKTIAEVFSSTIHLLQILKDDDENRIDVIKAQMEFFAKMHTLKKYELHLYRDNDVIHGVQNFNKEAAMDLICIRTHGRKGIAHLLLGSIAERLVNNCKKPVLTFHLKDI